MRGGDVVGRERERGRIQGEIVEKRKKREMERERESV
jgi:hypothetical protein